MSSTAQLIDILVSERLGDPGSARFHGIDLPATPGAPREARLFAWAASPPLADDDMALLSLLTSELVTNAVLHARAPLTYGLAVTDELVLVAVGDGDPVLPEPSSGRGLRLVASLAARWGMRPVDSVGKVVWFTLDRVRQP